MTTVTSYWLCGHPRHGTCLFDDSVSSCLMHGKGNVIAMKEITRENLREWLDRDVKIVYTAPTGKRSTVYGVLEYVKLKVRVRSFFTGRTCAMAFASILECKSMEGN